VIHSSAPLALALALAFPASLGCAPEGPGGSARADRIESEVNSIRSALEECRRSDLPEIIRKSVAQTLELPEHESLTQYVDLEDWIVLREELRCFERWSSTGTGEVPHQVERRKATVQTVKGYADALAERGVDLLLVPIPTRVQVYPDRLPGVPRIEEYRGFDAGYLQLLHELLTAGVEVVDLLPEFFARRFDESGENDPLLYLDFDTHWTARGASLCADIVAERIRQLDWFEPGPDQEGVDFVVRRESGLIRLRRTPSRKDHSTTLWYECIRDPDGQPAQATSDESPILLLGDSFSTIYSHPRASDLVRLLYARLGWKLDAIVVRGGGANSVWSSLARRSEGVGDRRLVLWIISARAIGSGTMQAQDVFGEGR